MPIHLACPSCGAKGTLPDAAAGKSARCPRCKATLVIPILSPPPAPPPEFVPEPPSHSPEDDLEFDPTAPPDTHAPRRYNPFDDGVASAPAESEVEKAKARGKRKYTSGYNPFEGAPAPEDAPVEDPFDYSESDAPAGPAAGAFEFDQPTPRRKRR
jgi:hypothetical protein